MDQKTKQDGAFKLIKILNLYNNSAATLGEKENAKLKIEALCEKYHFRVEGNQIFDTDIKEEPKQEQPKQEAYNPHVSNRYVIYKGKKYYNGVPREVYTDYYIDDKGSQYERRKQAAEFNRRKAALFKKLNIVN